jgi:uncharacterized protein (DUF58 family)
VSPSGLTFPLLPRRRVVGLGYGEMRSRRRGKGYDVAGSRPYRPGDDMRLIDRHASARLSSARESDEFVVRQHDAEEMTRVAIVVDRRPSMALYPTDLPWLHKPAVLAEAGRMVIDSALQARCTVSLLDADGESRLGAAPRGRAETWLLEEQLAGSGVFAGPDDSVDRAFAELARSRHLPAGSFVFVFSDFLTFPSAGAWQTALERLWEVIPVVVQDALWEQSFPDIAGATVPIADPRTGRLAAIRLSRREVEERRRENEERLARMHAFFVGMELDAVFLSTDRSESIYEAFVVWAEARRFSRWLP